MCSMLPITLYSPGHVGSFPRIPSAVLAVPGERVARRLLGLFSRSKCPDLHVNPIGVIPKSEPGRWHIIVDLSSPQSSSVSDGINRELCSLLYMSVDEASEAGKRSIYGQVQP